MLAAAVWAATDAEVLTRAEALVRAGRYAEAYQLLEPLEDKLAGDVKFDYLLARAALETGRASLASFIYERILAVEPNFVGVRLEMGRAYLALGDYARAKLEFETVLRFQNLPPDLREQALIYGKAADDYLAGKRTVGFGYAEYGYGHDSNALSATRISEINVAGGILILPPSALERGDHYHAVSLGGELVYALTERFSAFAGGDARARKYNDIDETDFGNLDGRVGLGYGEGAHNTRLGLTAGRYWLDDLKVRDTWGLMADYRYLATKHDQLSVSVVASRFQFRPETLKANDYVLYQAAVGWLRAVRDGRGVVGITLLGGFEKATNSRLDGDKPFLGARLTLQHALTDRVGAFSSAARSAGSIRRSTRSLRRSGKIPCTTRPQESYGLSQRAGVCGRNCCTSRTRATCLSTSTAGPMHHSICAGIFDMSNVLNGHLMLLVVACLIPNPGAAWAQSAEPAGRFVSVVGDVGIVDRNGAQRNAARGSDFREGETLLTGPEALAQLRMADGALLTVRGNTEIKLDRFTYGGKEDRNASFLMSILKGGMRTITGFIARLNRSGYAIRTPAAEIGVRGTHFEVVHILQAVSQEAPAGTYNRVYEGITIMQNAAGPLQVIRDQTGFAALQGTAPPVLVAPPAAIFGRPTPVPRATFHSPIETPRTVSPTLVSPIEAAPTLQTAPTTIQTAPTTTLQTGTTTPIQTAPILQSAPAPIQTGTTTPIQTAPILQSAPAPIQPAPAPNQPAPAIKPPTKP